MAQKRILIPTKSIDDWQALLSEPDKHWRTGYSAMMMAQSWEKADGLPPEITSAFIQSGDDNFNNLELTLAIPEYQTHLKGGPRPSQSDVFALLRSENCLIAVTIEGKARENFGPTLDQWQNGVSEKGAGKRLSHIRNYIVPVRKLLFSRFARQRAGPPRQLNNGSEQYSSRPLCHYKHMLITGDLRTH